MADLKSEDRAALELLRQVARREIGWSTTLVPSIVGAQGLALIRSAPLPKAPNYQGRIPDPVPLRVAAEFAADRLLADGDAGDDWRIIAEYATELIRSNILEK